MKCLTLNSTEISFCKKNVILVKSYFHDSIIVFSMNLKYIRFMAKKKTAHKILRTLTNFVIIPLLLLCIALSISMCILFFKRPAALGITISSILTGFFTVPLTLILRPKIRRLVRDSDSSTETELYASQKELESLKQENLEFKSKADFYRYQIQILENLAFNMETYSDVFKVCFRDYRQTATIKQRERFNESDYSNAINKLIGNTSKNYDELISVMDCIVTYQRGVDIQNIRITQVAPGSIVVSGIKPEYTARPVFDYTDFFSEIRHVRLDKNGEAKNITVPLSTNSAKLLERKQSEYKSMYEKSFLSEQNQFDDSAEIIKRAQDFISIILHPLYSHIEFSQEAPATESLPLLEYLHQQTNEYKALLEQA